MRRLLGTLTLLVLIQYPASVNAQVQSADRQASDPVGLVVAAKLMTNYPDGNFHPERLLSRAELASIMVKTFRLDKRKVVSKENLVVTDVSSSDWAFNDIQTVLKTDIMKGYRGNLFFPNQKVTRAEAWAIFAQAYGVFQFGDRAVDNILARYPDATSIPSWARKAIATVVSEGFVKKDAQGNISPLQPMTRGDLADLLSKYLQRQQQQPDTPIVPGPPAINP